MTMSNTQAISFALIPGCAESLERHATGVGNMAWEGMAKGVKDARNALYLGVAVVVVAATGAALSDSDSTGRHYACATIATLGMGVATLAAKKLYEATSFLQRVINHGARPAVEQHHLN